MVRVSLTHVLLFIAVISVSTMFVGVIVTETGLYAQSTADESDREVAAIDAEIDIVNDAEAGSTYNGSEVTLYVKNVGGGSLDPADVDLVLDGEYVEPNGTTVFGYPDTAWREGAVLELTVPASLESGDHRVLVEIDGARDRLEFRVA